MPAQPGWPDALQADQLVAHGRALIGQAWGEGLGPGEPDTARQVQFQLRPGAGVSVVYSLRRGTSERFIGLTTEIVDPAPGLRQIDLEPPAGARGPLRVTTWLHPHDPRLPGLPHAGVAAEAERLWGDGDRLTGLRTITYRPLRRAVFRAEFSTPGPVVSTRTVYLKAMRPEPATGLALRHRLLADASLPVATTLGPVRHGVVATAALPGRPLSTLIAHDGGASLDPASLPALLDRFPEDVLDLARRPAWSERLGRYAQAATAALPQEEQSIAALARHLEGIIATSDPGPVVPVHGDFYEANLLMDGTRVCGLLDLDSVGPGHRVDDLACLLGHLAVLPAVSGRYTDIDGTVDRFGAAFSRGVDGRALHARAAAVAISLVAGARRPGVEDWSRSARARLDAVRGLADRAG